MRLSTRSRYGVRFMLELALRNGDTPVMLKDIAKAQKISEKYLSQIVIPLKHAGLITSTRGAKGGYFLAKKPSEITMMDLTLLLEDHFFIVECLNNPTECEMTGKCASHNFWAKLQLSMTEILRNHTLADMIDMHNIIER